MVSVLFVTKVVLVLNFFTVGTPLKKKTNGHTFRVAKNRGSLSKRHYLYNPYAHIQQHYLRTDRRSPYARPFFYFKTNAQRRQSLPRNRESYPYKRFFSNPHYYESKIKSNQSISRPYTGETSNGRVHNYDASKRPPMLRKMSGAGIPLQLHSDDILKTGSSFDEPSASGDGTTGNVMNQGSFKIDDGPVKGIGTYQIRGDDVDVDVHIRIIPGEGEGSGEANTPSAGDNTKTKGGEAKPTTAPGGGEGSSSDEPSSSGDKTTSSVTDQGSFKIDDGPVKGFGTYQIRGDNIEVSINIKIIEASTGEGEGSGEAKTTASPSSGGNATTKAGEAKPTTASSSGGNATTKAGEVKPTTASSTGGNATTKAGEAKPTTASSAGGNATTKAGEAKPTTAQGGGEDVSAFEQEALKAHNEYRARHDAPAMTLNKEMSKEAAEWAEELGANEKFEHSPSEKRQNQGENIAAWTDAEGETATQVTKRWYDEVCDPGYDFSRNDMDWSAGHFTQVVWKKSTELGIGFYDKKREDDGWVSRTIVARYREPGNGGGTFLENVKKGSYDETKDCTKQPKKRFRVTY